MILEERLGFTQLLLWISQPHSFISLLDDVKKLSSTECFNLTDKKVMGDPHNDLHFFHVF